MAGYCGYSMSNNAVAAYSDGEKPLTKWTKTEIISRITPLITCDISLVKKLSVSQLRDLFLFQSSWHHTSNWYNKTYFYSIDEVTCETVSDKDILNLLATKEVERSEEQTEKKVTCKFLEWSGSRKHPKATVVIEDGVIKGNWFYRNDGTKKSINANGFEIIKEDK